MLNQTGHTVVTSPQAGDVIHMQAKADSGWGNHWGIMISSSEFIHASGGNDAKVKVAKISGLRSWARDVEYLRYW